METWREKLRRFAEKTAWDALVRREIGEAADAPDVFQARLSLRRSAEQAAWWYAETGHDFHARKCTWYTLAIMETEEE